MSTDGLSLVPRFVLASGRRLSAGERERSAGVPRHISLSSHLDMSVKTLSMSHIFSKISLYCRQIECVLSHLGGLWYVDCYGDFSNSKSKFEKKLFFFLMILSAPLVLATKKEICNMLC